MASCVSGSSVHSSAMWGCSRTKLKLLTPVFRSSSGFIFKKFTENVSLHYCTAVNRTVCNVTVLRCRASTTQSQLVARLSFDRLNAEQMAAVQTEEDCVRVVAGPGSGKTLVLTHRIAHLIQNRGVDPSKMLCLTFTNKAKLELQERLQKLLGDRYSKITVGTFHSICVRMLRESVNKKDDGVDKDFVIYDENDSTIVLKKAIQETVGLEAVKTSRLDTKEGDEESRDKMQKQSLRALDEWLRKIANLKDFELKLFLAKRNQVANLPKMPWELASALPTWKRYKTILRSYNAVDFDDLIHLTVRMLHQRSDLCEGYQNRWSYILADEFQDTDWAQYEMVRRLCATNQKLFVVGDVDQAIYGWRGADYRNMDGLGTHFQGLTTLELRRNYRSSQNILKLASEVIKNSRRSAVTLRPLKLKPTQPMGAPVTVVNCLNSYEEGRFIINKISTLVGRKQASFGSFGVLYRTRAQGRELEACCLAKKIPYTISGSIPLLSSKEVKDVRAYLQVIWNAEDRVALDRIINFPPRGLGPKTLKRVEQWASDLNISFYQGLQKIRREEISHKDLGITPKARNAIVDFCNLQEDVLRISENDKVSKVIQEVIDRTQILEYLKKTGDGENLGSKLQSFQKLAVSTDNEHGSGKSALCSFLEAVALRASLDLKGPNPDAVILSTIHAAKGLEFDTVFMAGADDGNLPYTGSDLEEERRLFYVGVTRARKELVITYRRQKFDPKLGIQKEGKLSSFLNSSKCLYEEETLPEKSLQPVPVLDWYAMRSQQFSKTGRAFR